MKKPFSLSSSAASFIALAAAALLTTGGAQAQSVYGQVGTTGATLGYAQHFGSVNLRGDVNYLNYSHDIDAGSVRYGSKLKLSNVGLFADYFPMGQFRVTGGFFVGGDKVNAYGGARLGSDIPEGESVSAGIKSKSVRPYVGVGWGLSPQATGLSFVADVGVSYGRFRTDYVVSPGLQAAWGNERVQQERSALDSKINDMKWYPVVRIGAAYRF